MSDYVTNTRFDQATVAQRADMADLRAEINHQFATFFGKMMERFDRIEQELAKKADADKMYVQFDAMAQRLGIDDQERAAMGHQLDRHQSWINQLATTTGTTLTEVI